MPTASELALEAHRALVPAILPVAHVSFPVPVRRPEGLAAACFGARTSVSADGSDERMYAPAAEVLLDWATGRRIELNTVGTDGNRAPEDPVASVRPLAFRSALDPGALAQLDAQIRRLYVLLDAAAARYGATPQRSPMDDGTRYLEQWEDLVPREARPYHIALNPDFFAWVERGR